MALTVKKPRALTIFVQTCIVMLIFYFVGCTAETCLSYGHSCWGAHGKRSDIQSTSMAVKSLLNGSPQNGIAPSFKMQWILSRLITGQPILPLADKYRVRWDFPKDKLYVPLKWDHDRTPMIDDIKSRIPITNKNEDNERRISNIQGTMHNINEKLETNREIFVISPGEYDKPINDYQKSNIIKFLVHLVNEGNGNIK